MITHFLRRDFLDFKSVWAAGAAVTVLSFFLVPDSVSLGILGYLYFLFAMAPIATLTGSSWRGQFAISRSYLLSLPVSRHRLYWMIQIRALVFWAPFLTLVVLTPIVLPDQGLRMKASGFNYLTLLLTMIVLCLWFTNRIIGVSTDAERMGRHDPIGTRIRNWLLSIVPLALEIFLIIFFVVSFRFAPSSLLCLLPLTGLTAYRFLQARRAWLGG